MIYNFLYIYAVLVKKVMSLFFKLDDGLNNALDLILECEADTFLDEVCDSLLFNDFLYSLLCDN
jgi:hypothetical protein